MGWFDDLKDRVVKNARKNFDAIFDREPERRKVSAVDAYQSRQPRPSKSPGNFNPGVKLDRSQVEWGSFNPPIRAAAMRDGRPGDWKDQVTPFQPPPKPLAVADVDEDPNAKVREEAVDKQESFDKALQRQRDEMLQDKGVKAPPGADTEAKKVEAKDNAEVRDRMRDAGLGRKPGEELAPTDVDTGTYDMTEADYNALNDNSRAGVDANTIIEEALRSGDVPAELKARLKQLKLPSGKKVFDEYTSLEALVDDKDIKNVLSDEGIAKTVADAMGRLSPFSRKEGESVFSNPRASMVIELSEAAKELRGRLNKNILGAGFDVAAAVARDPESVAAPEGFGNSERDQMLRAMYSDFMRKATPEDDRRAHLAEGSAMDPSALSAFLEYADRRSQNEKNYGIKLGKKSRTPEEFRELLGLDRGEE
jgi:hypothetical protein